MVIIDEPIYESVQDAGFGNLVILRLSHYSIIKPAALRAFPGER
jgi:hypothetical protein